MKLYITLRKTINIDGEYHEVIGVYKNYHNAKNDIDSKAANDIFEVELKSDNDDNIDSVIILFYKTVGTYLTTEQDRYVGCFLNQKEIDSFLRNNNALFGKYFTQEIKIQ